MHAARLPTVYSGTSLALPELDPALKEGCLPLAILEASLVYGFGNQVSEVSTPGGLSEFSIPDCLEEHALGDDVSPKALCQEDLAGSDSSTIEGSSSSNNSSSCSLDAATQCPAVSPPCDRRSHALLEARRWSIERELCNRFGAENCKSVFAPEDLGDSPHAAASSRGASPVRRRGPADSPAAGLSAWFNPLSWFSGTADARGEDAEVGAMDGELLAAEPCARCELHAAAATLLEGLDVETHCGVINGAIVLSGSLEEFPEAISNALREALVSSIEPRANSPLVVCVWRGADCAASAGWTVISSQHLSSGAGAIDTLSLDGLSFARFDFQIATTAPDDAAPVLRHLLMEAASGGAQGMLPELVEALGPEVGRLALRLEVAPVNSSFAGERLGFMVPQPIDTPSSYDGDSEAESCRD